jgi:purine nucleoside permease
LGYRYLQIRIIVTGEGSLHGAMTTQAEQWTLYWTNGKGRLATTAMEDCGVLQSLTFLAQAKKVRLDRALVLRTGANYTLPPAGETAAQLLAQEAGLPSQGFSGHGG